MHFSYNPYALFNGLIRYFLLTCIENHNLLLNQIYSIATYSFSKNYNVLPSKRMALKIRTRHTLYKRFDSSHSIKTDILLAHLHMWKINRSIPKTWICPYWFKVFTKHKCIGYNWKWQDVCFQVYHIMNSFFYNLRYIVEVCFYW